MRNLSVKKNGTRVREILINVGMVVGFQGGQLKHISFEPHRVEGWLFGDFFLIEMLGVFFIEIFCVIIIRMHGVFLIEMPGVFLVEMFGLFHLIVVK